MVNIVSLKQRQRNCNIIFQNLYVQPNAKLLIRVIMLEYYVIPYLKYDLRTLMEDTSSIQC